MGWRHSDPASGRVALTEPTLHIVFTDSGAESLREALRLAGRGDEVIALPDDLSLGPIAVTAADRAAWFGREMGADGWREYDSVRAGFWSAALHTGRWRVAWWSWRPAQEYCGFLAFVSRLGDGACDAVDLSETHIVRPARRGATTRTMAGTLYMFTPEAILENGLLDRAEPLAPGRRAGLLDLWSLLRSEDAPLRVPTGGGGLVSAPLTFYDDELLHHTPGEWRPTARTVAEVLAEFLDTGLYRVGDRLLAARVHALAAAGRIELRGGDPCRGLAGTEIRLAYPAAPHRLP
jgi:uncharacterized protein DUF3658/uncharacterized protein DUF1835